MFAFQKLARRKGPLRPRVVEKGTPRHQGSDAGRQREGVQPGILFPTILVRRRPAARDASERPPHHVDRLNAAKGLTFGQGGREQHRIGHLVELDPAPGGLAPEPLVLVPMAFGILGGDQVAQRVAGLRLAAEGEQRARAFDEVARPDEMIAAALVPAVAPGHAEAGHHRARIGLVEMGAQDQDRGGELLLQDCRNVRRSCAGLTAAPVPGLPVRDLAPEQIVEGLQQGGHCKGCRRFATAAETETEHTAIRQFRHQGYVAGPGCRMLPGHRAIPGKVLPAVARADIAGARTQDRILLRLVDGSQRQRER